MEATQSLSTAVFLMPRVIVARPPRRNDAGSRADLLARNVICACVVEPQLTDVLVVAAAVRVLNGVHGHAAHLGPLADASVPRTCGTPGPP